MSAGEVRTPVLLGPVPCIGCAPRTRTAAPTPPLRVSVGGGAIGIAVLFVFPVPALAGAREERSVDMSLDRLFAWESCSTDIQLSDVRARAWFALVPIFYYQYEVSLDAEARRVLAGGASCAAR